MNMKNVPHAPQNHVPGGGARGHIRRQEESKHLSAGQLLKEFAKKHNLASPASLFAKPKEDRDSLLADYCAEALRDGWAPSQIADAIIKWRYPAKLINYQDVSLDQAAGTIVLASTSKVNWFDMLSYGVPIVERGALLNGMFGRMTTNNTDITDTVAAVLYLANHEIAKELPQAPWIIFGGRAKSGADFEAEKEAVISQRAAFEERVKMNMESGHWFRVDDAKHRDTVKFRLLCAIWHAGEGRLYVASKNAKPQPFADWAAENLNDVLSSSNAEIAAMKGFIAQIGLLKMMKNPQPFSSEYKPWSYLKGKVGESGGIFGETKGEAEHYRQAVKAWRLATIMLQLESLKSYEANWQATKVVEEILDTNLKLACDDGRQSGDVKVLGGIISKKEFEKMFIENNAGMATLRFVPHYGCGFLTAAQDLHNALQKLRALVKSEPSEFERERMARFFAERLKMVLEDAWHNPVATTLGLRAKVPSALREEFDRLLEGKEPASQESRALVSALVELFADSGNKRLRSVFSRAVEVGVFERQDDGFYCMGAAEKTYRKLKELVGSDFGEKLTKKEINALVTEEAARQAYEKYLAWSREAGARGKHFKIEFFMDNFVTGQATEVPPEPRTKEEALNLFRKDHYLGGFGGDEIKALGLEKWMEWRIPS